MSPSPRASSARPRNQKNRRPQNRKSTRPRNQKSSRTRSRAAKPGRPPAHPPAQTQRARPEISVRGARQNNLRGIDVSIPHEALTVVTGVSGSGKSSLAFETLYAEGQRRYAESFSAYVRQFLERLPRPRVDAIEGMLPAIAIEQQAAMGGGRSTVATMTDLADYLKVLYARSGELHCPECGVVVKRASATSLRDRILEDHAGARAMVLFPVSLAPVQAGRVAKQRSRGKARATKQDAKRGQRTRGKTTTRRNAQVEEAAQQAQAEADRLRQAALLRKLGYTRVLEVPGWRGEQGPLPKGPPTVLDLDAGVLEQAEPGWDIEAAATHPNVTGSHGRPRGAPVLWMVADRLQLRPEHGARLLEALEQGLHLGSGPVAVLVQARQDAPWHALRLAEGLRCASCGRHFAPPTPSLFSYNTPVGACETCGGFGRTIDIDWDLVIPDPSLSLAAGAIRPWSTESTKEEREHLELLCDAAGIPMDVPWRELTEAQKEAVLGGVDTLWGLRDWFDWLASRTYRAHVRIQLARYRAYRTCLACGGSRLKPEALAYRVGGKSLGNVYAMTVAEARAFFDGLAGAQEAAEAPAPHAASRDAGSPKTPERAIRETESPAMAGAASPDPLAPVRREIRSRLRYLEEVGLGYLTLNRPARTLSGGEAQRVTLTSALGASLVHTLFVLDEPTVGLHPRDTGRLLAVLRQLVAAQNTVVVVEHDPDVIRAADHVVDLGPGAGEAGGELLYAGPPRPLLAAGAAGTGALGTGAPLENTSARAASAAAPCTPPGAARAEAPTAASAHALALRSRTAALVSRPGRVLDAPPPRRTPGGPRLEVHGARAHNLREIDVAVPLGTLTCVTGVSGSGKSTLVEHVLARGLARHLGRPTEPPGAHRAITGVEALADVVFVDASPAAASPRATPLTYVDALTRIRQLFARTEDARARGLGPGAFSWNSPGGRCEACEGTGTLRVELHFLPDAEVRCEVCEGRRFTQEVLSVRYRGKNLDDVLGMTVTEGLAFFEGERKIQQGLSALADVGLGYLRLGQGLHTLSGGEAQRLKVARHLASKRTTGSLFLLDEPTRGLHLADVGVLLAALHRLVDKGNTVLVVEHHPEVIWQADHVIDLGPEGGDGGGLVVVTGPPEAVCAEPRSHTGRFLSRYLGTPTDSTRADGTTAASATAAALPHPAAAPDLASSSPSAGALRAAEAAAHYETVRTTPDRIEIHGAREHNLKDLDLTLPRDQLVVITGPSGSGKSTVAFDILHAEGQRRFLDCLSPYARQYMQQLARPDLAALHGVPPTIAVEQRITRGRRMSTVATVTEIYPYLRLLFAKAGRQVCPRCDAPTASATPDEILEEILRRFAGRTVRLLAPVLRRRKGWHDAVLDRARQLGLHEVRVDGRLRPLSGSRAPTRLARYRLHDIDFVLAHERVTRRARAAWGDRVRQALNLGSGQLLVLPDRALAPALLGTERVCGQCGVAYPPPDPRLFSFTTEAGACPACEGTGAQEDGGVCRACGGTRLRVAARYVTLQGRAITDLHAMRPPEAAQFLAGLQLEGALAAVLAPIRAELTERLGFLSTVGLDYLSLDRSAASLSGGEVQRLRLAAHLSAPLHGVLYILDEPTIGLHPEDHARLLQVLLDLRRARNTVVLVEHDEATMRAADFLVDLGPGGGRKGGRLVEAGPPEVIARQGTGITARLLRGEVGRPAASGRLARPSQWGPGWIRIHGATAHNLQRLQVSFPRGALSVIAGRSGSGKSTLLEDVLLATARAGAPEGCRRITGLDAFGRVVEVDQRPIGRNPRSCPATYVGLMTRLRERFAALPEARIRGFGPGRFSFNVAGGRCPTCEGHGWLTVEMGFLPDAHVPCPRCQGRRYHQDTLAIRMGDLSIADVLALPAEAAAERLGADPRLGRILNLFVDIGLGYLQLGQPSPTLSGGEAQRIKLVEELSKTGRGNTLYLLDEPTTGLHGADVERLLGVLNRLVDRGDTVILIEHHLAVIAAADWVVDLGPGPGPEGGRLLYQGPPGPLAADPDAHPESATARWLARQCAPGNSGRQGTDLDGYRGAQT